MASFISKFTLTSTYYNILLTIIVNRVTKRNTTVLEYPVVLRKHLNYMTISILDLGITLIEELKINETLNKDYVTKIEFKIAQAWVKAQKILRKNKHIKSIYPKPQISEILKKNRKKPLPLPVLLTL